MEYEPREVAEALQALSIRYPDAKVDNHKAIGSTGAPITVCGQEYLRQSLKRSSFKNVTYLSCIFENVAFTGSAFHTTDFQKCGLIGNSFICCDFYNSMIQGDGTALYTANNFSQSNFTACKLQQVRFVSSGFLQTLFQQCLITDSQWKSSTLEGTQFVNCELCNVDFGNVNVEFTSFTHSNLMDVSFPFYQLPYIIGAADYIRSPHTTVTACVGNRFISMSEYREQIPNLIKFFWDKGEYFPMCNLFIAQNDLTEARECMKNGINAALQDVDFRIIRHYCRMAQHHGLLDDISRQHILKQIDDFLSGSTIPPERLNNCLIHAGEIRGILLAGQRDSIGLHLNIRTNVRKNDVQGRAYINSLCNDLNHALSTNDYGQVGFQVAVSNHSPFEIIIDVIGATGAIASVASLIWAVIGTRKADVSPTAGAVQVDPDVYRDYIDAKLDLYKERLLHIREENETKELDAYIEEVTQQLRTDLVELYDRDIMIFRKKNKRGKSKGRSGR